MKLYLPQRQFSLKIFKMRKFKTSHRLQMAKTSGHAPSHFLLGWIQIFEGGRILPQPVFTWGTQDLLHTVASLSFSRALVTKADVAACE